MVPPPPWPRRPATVRMSTPAAISSVAEFVDGGLDLQALDQLAVSLPDGIWDQMCGTVGGEREDVGLVA